MPNEKADDLKGLFMELGSAKDMEFDMLDEVKDLKEVSCEDKLRQRGFSYVGILFKPNREH